MAAIAYLRVSTDEQAQSGLGLEAQIEAIQNAVGTPEAIYRDEGYSGSNAKRPGLLDALDALREGDTLVVAKRDRLARDTFLALWIEKEVKRRKGRIISAAGEGTESEDPAAKLMRTIVDAFAEYERNLIGARTTAALQQKQKRGEKTGGDVPYGFQVADDGIHLHADTDEQLAVDIISELHRRGYSLRQICDELQARGIRTKRGNSTWQPRVISRLIKRAA